MHFTLARFYVRSKGKCSGCKRLAEYCYSASNLGRFYVRSRGKCSWCKSLAEYCYSASNLGRFYVRSKVARLGGTSLTKSRKSSPMKHPLLILGNFK